MSKPHTLSLPFHALSSQPRACRQSFLSISLSLPLHICIFSLIRCFCVAFSPPRPLSPRLTTVTAFPADNRKPYLAVRSAQPWKSWQFTCSHCRILYPFFQTRRNYNPCINKWTWLETVCGRYAASNTHLPKMLHSATLHNQQTGLFQEWAWPLAAFGYWIAMWKKRAH